MVSKNNCPHCGITVHSNERECPFCGSRNWNYVEGHAYTVTTPKTIEELRIYSAEHSIPLYRMRFFVGENFKAPYAYGIYRKDDKTIVVYHNKSTGDRMIRYEGPDEAFGVNELFQKLTEECRKRALLTSFCESVRS